VSGKRVGVKTGDKFSFVHVEADRERERERERERIEPCLTDCPVSAYYTILTIMDVTDF